MIDEPTDDSEYYERLPEFAALRNQELIKALEPVASLTDAYGDLVSRAVVALGRVKPASRQESIVRDLIADVFDFLYEWKRPLFEGRLHIGFPLGRRAYESLSLLSVCYQDPVMALRWDGGSQIGNSAIRDALAKLPFGETKEGLQTLYKLFSQGSHPNRALVSERYLGDDNAYVLGSIGMPEMVLVVDQCITLVELWFWFGALVSHVAREPLRQHDSSFGEDYRDAAGYAKHVKQWLVESYNNLLAARQAEIRADLARRSGSNAPDA